jgi:hypothetical protein
MKLKYLFSILVLSFSQVAYSVQVKEMYTMEPSLRSAYLVGVYDSILVDWSDGGLRSDCLEEMGFSGFVKLISDFIVALPEEPHSKERQVYDNMNAAALSNLLFEKKCGQPKK